MQPLAFLIAAYGITLLGLGGLLVHAWQRMRRAERELGTGSLSGDQR